LTITPASGAQWALGSPSWATASNNNGVETITASANSAANSRTGNVTVTSGSGTPPYTVTLPLTQAGVASMEISSQPPNGIVGVPYSFAVTATGGTTPYTFTATGLPSGLTLSGSTISGTPTASGLDIPGTITVTDSTQPTHLTVTDDIQITISATAPPLTLSKEYIHSGSRTIAVENQP
jgi:hypothetical protein